MKTITLKEAFQIIQDASAIIVNDSVLVYPALDDINGNEENEFMYVEWEEDGLEYCLKFAEGDNETVTISGSSMFLFDTDAESDDDLTQITILTNKNLE